MASLEDKILAILILLLFQNVNIMLQKMFYLKTYGMLLRGNLGYQWDNSYISLNVRFVLSIYFQDYPSVSQVASKLREKNANMIFAVMENVVKEYGKLGAFLDGAVVGKLEKDSANIVELISEKYHVSSTIFFSLHQYFTKSVSISSDSIFYCRDIDFLLLFIGSRRWWK